MINSVEFPEYSGVRCLMMPYIQGDPNSVPDRFSGYRDIIENVCIKSGDVGYLTIDESPVRKGVPHRGQRAKHGRALHTEAGLVRKYYCWGYLPTWGGRLNVVLEPDVRVLLASNMSHSCAVWDTEHPNTTEDGDIGHVADMYPYRGAKILEAGELCNIGILTPHESLPANKDGNRQFLRIVSSGVLGREPYFTENPILCS